MMRHTVRDALGERRWIAPGADVAPVVPRAAGGRPAGTSSRSSFGTPPATMPGASDWIFAGAEAAGSAPEPAGSALRYAEQRLLGQLLGTYLVLESDAGLLLIDQHAAHERVLYEQLRAGWRERAVERQGLLLPLTVELGPGALAALAGASDDVARLGFEVEPFGPGTVALRSVPALLAERDPADLVRDLADEICAAEAGPGAGPISLEAADRIFASLACHAARRKGDVLDHAEQRALLESVDRIPYAPTCPHGRPVAVPLDLAEIERRFARR
jgi:DNA mismatch repair protein MutL